ncbi:MAG: hypothetical protein AAFR81_30240 [Chloroflexota bacterium]
MDRVQLLQDHVDTGQWFGLKPLIALRLADASEYLSQPEDYRVGLALWWGDLYAGLDWIEIPQTDDGEGEGETGILVKRIIEPVYRERMEWLDAGSPVIVFSRHEQVGHDTKLFE